MGRDFFEFPLLKGQRKERLELSKGGVRENGSRGQANFVRPICKGKIGERIGLGK